MLQIYVIIRLKPKYDAVSNMPNGLTILLLYRGDTNGSNGIATYSRPLIPFNPHPLPLSLQRRGVTGKVASDFMTTNALAGTNLKISPIPTP